jgi:hypothetical protein
MRFSGNLGAMLRGGLIAFIMPVMLMMAQVAATSTARADQASGQDRIAVLLQVLALDEIIAIMREEGLAYGKELGADMLSGGGGATWDMLVDRIYDVDKMRLMVRDRFVVRFGQTDPDPLISFFQTDTGQQIVALEVAARRAFMDATIEEAARDAFRAVEPDLTADSPRGLSPHLSAIEAYIEANDLIGFNVMGAMNANRLFYRGLVDGGALEMSEADIMADMRGQLSQTETETREWIYAFLMLAYAPLDASQINAYADLSLTPHGRAMNSALFDAFDLMYGDVSRALGLAIAGQMLSEDL